MREKIPNGFILLSRELLSSKLWSCSDATFRVAIYLLLRVNYEPNYFKRALISRGQTAVSIATISNDCGVSIKSVRHALKILVEDEFIFKDSPFGAQQGQRITILKYDSYQNIDNYRGTVGAHEGTYLGNDEGTYLGNPIKEVKKERKKEEGEAQAPQAPPFRPPTLTDFPSLTETTATQPATQKKGSQSTGAAFNAFLIWYYARTMIEVPPDINKWRAHISQLCQGAEKDHNGFGVQTIKAVFEWSLENCLDAPKQSKWFLTDQWPEMFRCWRRDPFRQKMIYEIDEEVSK